ncbi:unnamed protein product [Amoebophrya sp. A25]|nr:unnamed protein product [Amoebophrya sp. A25]|eukprot:GSA25T00020810001.1
MASSAPAPRPVLLGEVFPDFACETTTGNFTFHEFLTSDEKRPWTVLFTHPNDFTPVCTTELSCAAGLEHEFNKRGVKMIGLSCNTVESHGKWTEDILKMDEGTKLPSCSTLPFPIIADLDRAIVTKLGMLDPAEQSAEGLPLPARCLYVIGPDKRMKLSILYPATTGRNFDEILRVIDSLQLTAKHKLATPVNWRAGDRLVVTPALSSEDAQAKFKNFEVKSLPSGKEYLRYVDAPTSP